MPVRCVAGQTYTFGISLESVANSGKFQVAPTLDTTNDFKISINGGAFASLTNAPTVTPSGGTQVLITLAASETTAAGSGGEIFLKSSDVSGNEWKDLAVAIRVHATDVDAVVASVTNGVTLTDGAITAAKIAADAITSTGLAASAVTEIQSGLATAAALATVDALVQAIKAKTDNLPADPADESNIQAALTAISAYIDTEVAAIKAKTDNLPAAPAATGDIPTVTAIADAVLGRSVSSVEGSAGLHSLTELILAILESSTASGSWIIKKTTGTTFNTRTLELDSNAVPIVGVS